MFNFELMKKLRAEGKTTKEAANYLYVNNIVSKLCKVYTKPKQHDCVFTFGSQKDTLSFYNYIYKDAPFYLTRKFKKFNYELV